MAENTRPDLHSVPTQALRTSTRDTISIRLNPVKVIPTDEGLPRDWRGLAHLAGLGGETMPCIGSSDPTALVLKSWNGCTLGQLTDSLKQLDRYDIVDDILLMIEHDAIKYLENQSRSYISAPVVNLEIDKQILTVDDVSRLEKGLEPQYYDAFLLFAEEDIDFAAQVVEKMETKYSLKLCLRDRDLVGGLTFEHEAIMRLISERCNRLIVIVSPSFLRSEANKFFVTFAQALGIEQRKRKVVPCLYQRCSLPPELSYYFLLDYTRSGTLWDFWAKMRDSLQSTVIRNNALSIRDIEENVKPILKHETASYSNKMDDTELSIEKSKHFDDVDDHTFSVPGTNNSNFNLSINKHSSTEKVKPKSGKWLRRLLPKHKSKRKKAEAL